MGGNGEGERGRKRESREKEREREREREREKEREKEREREKYRESLACHVHRSSAKFRLCESPSSDRSRVSRAMAAAARRIACPLPPCGLDECPI